MSRPQKNGLDYFPLDVTFFSDPKIKILKARYGVDGISIYIYLLCEIYRSGYYLQLNDDSVYIWSDDLRMSAEKVKQVLNFLLERSLFDRILFQSDKILTSAGIQKRFQLAVKARAKKNPIEVRDFWLLKEAETESFIKVYPKINSSGKNEDNSGKNGGFSRELSLKESKVNNIYIRTHVPDPVLNQAILKFIEARKGLGRPMTDEAVGLLIEKLKELSGDPGEQVRILNQSVLNGWPDIYPLKRVRRDENGDQKKAARTGNRFHNYEGDSYDYDEMVWKMMRDGPGKQGTDGDGRNKT